jgi:S-adenosylmethionine:tRNA ribosyltransferase-isomerase
VNDTRRHGGRVIAVGTTVVRALETVVDERGHVHPSSGWTDTVVTPDRVIRSIDGMLTGWHEPEASHLAMLQAVAGREMLER